MSTNADDARANRVATRATAAGIGLVVFMIAWTIGARITEQVWGPPSSAFAAMAAAIAAGGIAAILSARRLAA